VSVLPYTKTKTKAIDVPIDPGGAIPRIRQHTRPGRIAMCGRRSACAPSTLGTVGPRTGLPRTYPVVMRRLNITM
jgi:hypothetical protein